MTSLSVRTIAQRRRVPGWLVREAVLELVAAMTPELVRCAGCGLRGRWEGAVVVNAEGRDVPRWCAAPARVGNSVTVGRLRAHGPWLPV